MRFGQLVRLTQAAENGHGTVGIGQPFLGPTLPRQRFGQTSAIYTNQLLPPNLFRHRQRLPRQRFRRRPFLALQRQVGQVAGIVGNPFSVIDLLRDTQCLTVAAFGSSIIPLRLFNISQTAQGDGHIPALWRDGAN
jgi:hypothetical protein